MAITRTAKGTNNAKTGTTLTISSVQIDAGALLVVGIGYETDGGNPTSVKYGNKEMTYITNTGQTQGDTRCRMYRFKVKTDRTKDIVATWSTAPTAQVMFATEIKEAAVNDGDGGQSQTTGTSLDTTNVGTTTVNNTIAIGMFVTGGPSGDAQGTAGSGHTLGQRVGTAGGGGGTNVTIQETYEILSATGAIQATLTLSTSRISANAIVAFRARETYTLDEIVEPGLRAGAYASRAIFRFSKSGGTDVNEVLVPLDLFETYTNQQILDYCVQFLEMQAQVDDDVDYQVETIDPTVITALEGSTIVV